MNNKGKLIVIEGACDGIGKTTQYNLLYEHLKKDNEKIFNHHFPSYGTYYGVLVEKYLKGEYGSPNELSPYFVNALYAVDRAVAWQTILKEKYDDGNIILLDRYTTSSLIYQSASIESIEERKKFIDFVIDFEYNKIGIKKPDKVIFLTSSFEQANELRNKRQDNDGIVNDIHESNLEFMKKVYDNAVFVANYLNWDIINCIKDNKFRDKNEIHEEIYKLIKE